MLVIDAINDMIGYIGESPIDAADPDYTSHPLYESALRILNTTNEAVQSRGWWFNMVTRVLTPVTNAIALTSDVLTVTVVDDPRDFTIRASALFDMTNNTAVISTPLTAVVASLIAFPSLPITAAEYIKMLAAERFVKAYDGDAAKIASVKDDAAKAYIAFNTDNIRNSRVNLYLTRSMGPVLANNWYTRYRQR
jgi:hypothetical protein